MDVSQALKNPGQPYPFDATIDVPATIVLDDPVSFDGVRLVGDVVGAADAASVRGRLTATAVTRCARCLEPVKVPLDVAVDEIYARDASPGDDRYPFSGYRLDLTPMVQEALLLDLPLRVVCGEDCKGLCPICGINRNAARCTCQGNSDAMNPYSALSDELEDDEEV
ncbi:MAG: DUF177 domain-containing protein [Clostridiales bacterium]|nr:DUF177 domain-containing protein [Clostridiales bacterium]